VALLPRRAERLDEIVHDITVACGTAIVVPVDVTDASILMSGLLRGMECLRARTSPRPSRSWPRYRATQHRRDHDPSHCPGILNEHDDRRLSRTGSLGARGVEVAVQRVGQVVVPVVVEVGGGTVLGAVTSVAAYIADTYVPPHGWAAGRDWSPEAGAVIGAVFWPLALLTASETLARKRWAVAWLGAVGVAAVLLVALVATVISCQHLHGLLVHYRESDLSARIGPLTVDGLMIVCSLALVASDSMAPASPAPATAPVAPEPTASGAGSQRICGRTRIRGTGGDRIRSTCICAFAAEPAGGSASAPPASAAPAFVAAHGPRPTPAPEPHRPPSVTSQPVTAARDPSIQSANGTRHEHPEQEAEQETGTT
jgi:hypothetical protein